MDRSPSLVARRLALAAALAACGGATEPAQVSDPPAAAEDRARGPSPDGGAIEHAQRCAEATPLDVHVDDAGRVDRLHVDLRVKGRPGPFLVDTGAVRSFAVHDGTADDPSSAALVIGCRTTEVPVIARPATGATTPGGAARRGVLGADLVRFGAVVDLDLAGRALLWYAPAPEPPPGAVVLPVELREGWLIASGVRVGGRDVKLIVDTGAPHVLVMSDAARPGEVETQDTDGTGAPLTLYVADDDVALAGGAPRRVPVDRAASFPTLEGLIETLGGDVDGLLGLSAFDARRIVIGESALVVEPR